MLEYHDVGYKESSLQVRVMYVAMPYAMQSLEAPLELRIQMGGNKGGRGETASEGGGVKHAIEDALVETRVVVRIEEIVEAATSEHEGEEGARRGEGRVVVERMDDNVLHSVFEEEGGEHVEKETRKGERRGSEDIKDRCIEGIGCSSFRQRGVLNLNENLVDATPTSRWCDVVWRYVWVKLDEGSVLVPDSTEPEDGLLRSRDREPGFGTPDGKRRAKGMRRRMNRTYINRKWNAHGRDAAATQIYYLLVR